MALHKVFAILFVVAVVGDAFAATVFRNERSIESSHRHNREAEAEKSICEHRTPCGWAVYKRLTRQIDFYMKNSCQCPTGRKCVSDDDDISVSAYVYRCLPEKKEEEQKKEKEEQKKEEDETSRTR